jgi:hypothetical protein
LAKWKFLHNLVANCLHESLIQSRQWRATHKKINICAINDSMSNAVAIIQTMRDWFYTELFITKTIYISNNRKN